MTRRPWEIGGALRLFCGVQVCIGKDVCGVDALEGFRKSREQMKSLLMMTVLALVEAVTR